MINVIDDNKDFMMLYNKMPLPVVLWGLGRWGRLFIESGILEVNDICDAYLYENDLIVKGKKVLSPKELQDKYHKEEFYIINSFGTTVGLQDGLYIMASQYGYNAQIVNLHSNIGFDLGPQCVCFGGRELPLLSHIHNCGMINARMTERSLELAIAKEWIYSHKENIVEIGAVTPYYFPGVIKNIVDPADGHYLVDIHKSVFDVDLNGKNVLCISTVEHIGTGQYGIKETKNAVMAIEKILSESCHCLITTPLGENELVDDYLRDNVNDERLCVYYRKFYGNKWEMLDKQMVTMDYYIDTCKAISKVYAELGLSGANSGIIVISK